LNGEAGANLENYSQADVQNMSKGKAPQQIDPKTGKMESMELHHEQAVRDGGTHTRENLEKVWPNEHADVDPHRHMKR